MKCKQNSSKIPKKFVASIILKITTLGYLVPHTTANIASHLSIKRWRHVACMADIVLIRKPHYMTALRKPKHR
jgi:hypothetical protein